MRFFFPGYSTCLCPEPSGNMLTAENTFMDWSLVLQEWRLLTEVFLKLVSNPMLMLTLALGGITGMIAGMLVTATGIVTPRLLNECRTRGGLDQRLRHADGA